MELPIEQVSGLLDKWIIAGLFVFCFIVFIWRGLPYIAKAIDRMQDDHATQIRLLTTTFENSLKQITDKFISQIEQQHVEQQKFHAEHNEQLANVKKGLDEVNKTIKSQSFRK